MNVHIDIKNAIWNPRWSNRDQIYSPAWNNWGRKKKILEVKGSNP